jgi:hypothetical protein
MKSISTRRLIGDAEEEVRDAKEAVGDYQCALRYAVGYVNKAYNNYIESLKKLEQMESKCKSHSTSKTGSTTAASGM